MPVSIIVGGQYGSEGKGKVAHFFAKKYKAAAVVRVGGPNSGHTVIDNNGKPVIFKHLPTAAIIPGIKCVLTAGSYLNVEILQHEIAISGINKEDLLIDPYAVIVTEDDIINERTGDLIANIGSTGCGLGSAIINRISRSGKVTYAKDISSLRWYITDTNDYLRRGLVNNERIIVEGTQGFGLSLLHSNLHPFCTSRDTTAAGFLSEAGLSPLDVDDVVMVIRAFPIRVGGNSGPLKNETTWNDLSQKAGASEIFTEFTSVTKKLRRVAEFDAEVVKKAIQYNNPTKIVLNHIDYLDKRHHSSLTSTTISGLIKIQSQIARRVDFIGVDRKTIVPNPVSSNFSPLGKSTFNHA